MKMSTLTSGVHAFVSIETTPYAAGAPGSDQTGAGASGRTNKPAANDPSWSYCGIINASEIDPQREERDVFAPSPGVSVLFDVIEQKRQLNFSLTFEQMSRLACVLIFGTKIDLMNDSQTQFNPLEGSTVKGWMKIQAYDQHNSQWLVVDIFVHLKVASAVSLNDEINKVQCQARTLQSPLNTGSLSGVLG